MRNCLLDKPAKRHRRDLQRWLYLGATLFSPSSTSAAIMIARMDILRESLIPCQN
jgi:hypothetical protein